MTTITSFYPRLVVDGADDALTFYAKAFGADVLERFAGENGRVQHAMLDVGTFRFAVKDADAHDPAPTDGAVPVILALYVEDPTPSRNGWSRAGPRSSSPSPTTTTGTAAGGCVTRSGICGWWRNSWPHRLGPRPYP